MNRIVLAVVTALGASAVVPASAEAPADRFPGDRVERLDAEVARQMRDLDLPGLIAAITVPGEGRYVACRGKADLASDRAVAEDDPFRIASITKTFTATAVLQLIDRGKLRKTDTMSRWFPDFPGAEKITVAGLLRMRSGIAEGWDEGLLVALARRPLDVIDPETVIRRAASRADRFEPPGRKTVYRDVNYTLLGEIVRKVTGRDVGVAIREGVLDRLGMKETLYPVDARLPGGLRGYIWDAETKHYVDRTDQNPSPGAAGAMISTVADLQTYARALYKGTLLEPATQEARLDCRPIDGLPGYYRYGEGLLTIGRFYGHNGSIAGFLSAMYYLPEKDATVIIMVNRSNAAQGGGEADELFRRLSKIAFPDSVDW